MKIDKKFVTGIHGSLEAVKSLKRLIKMARSLGAEVIAEGIETQRDLDLLKDLGVRYGQGFYLSRPRAVAMPFKGHPFPHSQNPVPKKS